MGAGQGRITGQFWGRKADQPERTEPVVGLIGRPSGTTPEVGPQMLAIRSGDRMREERWRSRALALGLGTSLLVNLVLAATIGVLTPLRRDVPYFLSVAGRDQVVTETQALVQDSQAGRVIAEATAIRYVVVRNEIVPDAAVLARRWGTACLDQTREIGDDLCGFMYLNSSDEVYRQFEEQQRSGLAQFIQSRRSRTVQLDEDPIPLGTGQFEVRFTLIDWREGANGLPEEVSRRRLSANIFYIFRDLTVERRNRFVNPTGFVVTRYILTERSS